MKRFKIEYTECGESFSTVWCGQDAEHAEMRFIDHNELHGGNEGVEVKSVSCFVSEIERIEKHYNNR